jgi:hypothetical protein
MWLLHTLLHVLTSEIGTTRKKLSYPIGFCSLGLSGRTAAAPKPFLPISMPITVIVLLSLGVMACSNCTLLPLASLARLPYTRQTPRG